MAGDPTQVDWNYQLANIPSTFPPGGTASGDLSGSYPNPSVANILGRPLSMAGIAANKVLTWTGTVWAPVAAAGGSFSLAQANPNTGPFSGSPLTVDHATGLKAAAGPSLSNELVSLSQAGVLGTVGSQQVQGPTFFTGSLGVAGLPAWATSTYSAVVEDGRLGFYDSANDGAGNPVQAYIDWYNTTARVLTIYSAQGMTLKNDGFGGPTIIQSVGNNGSITLPQTHNPVVTACPYGVQMQTGTTTLYTLTMSPSFSFGTTAGPNLTKTAGGLPVAYGINSLAGATGTLLDGSTITGGLVMSVGATHAGGPPTGAAGGDLSGTYPNPVVAKLQTTAVSAVAPTSGDVLTFTGGVWIGAAIPLQTTLVHGGATVNVDAAGDIHLDPAAAHGLGAFGGAPAAQQTALGTVAGFTAHITANAVFDASTFTGGTGASAYTIGDVVLALKNYGLLAA